MFRKTMLLGLSICCVQAQENAPVRMRQWGQQSGSFQLSISSDKDQYAQGEIIKVTAALKNVADAPAVVLVMTPLTFYDMRVRVPVADWIPLRPEAALTPYGRAHTRAALADPQFVVRPEFMSTKGFYLQPSRETVYEFELNKLYEMSTPGVYHVTFSCKLPIQKITDPRIRISSNEIAITIAGK